MIKKALVCASLIALATSASVADTKLQKLTSDNQPYLRADVGFSHSKVKPSVTTEKDTRSKEIYNLGIGYKFDKKLRADLNVQKRRADNHVKANSIFVNAYYDFDKSMPGITPKFVPYVTAGLGYTENQVTNATNSNHNSFAYNVGAGSRVNVSKNVDLDIGYKFVNLGKVKNAGIKSKFNAHQLTAGVIFGF